MNTTILKIGILAAVLAVCLGMFVYYENGGSVNRFYYPDGQVFSETPMDRNGLNHGTYREWHENGAKRMETEFIHGYWLWVKHYDQSGKLVSEGQ